MRGACADDLFQRAKQRVLRVRAIEPLVPIAAANNQLRSFELGEFILNRPQREEAQARQLARIQLLSRVREQQSQHFGAHDGEQPMQQRLFDAPPNTRTFKQSSFMHLGKR